MGNNKIEFSIKTVDLKKIYYTGMVQVNALNGVNIEVKKGDIISVVGPSGSGKSTLLNMINALDRPTSGRILIDGIDITRLNDKVLSKFRNRKIGFVFQSYNLINRSTVKKNIELPAIVAGMPKRMRGKRVSELLDLVGLAGLEKRKPNMLSGGQQQRVAIARALINEPAFILADEPTGNLDSKTGNEITDLLCKINHEEGATIVAVTHDLEFADKTRRILHLRDGIIEKETEGYSYNEACERAYSRKQVTT